MAKSPATQKFQVGDDVVWMDVEASRLMEKRLMRISEAVVLQELRLLDEDNFVHCGNCGEICFRKEYSGSVTSYLCSCGWMLHVGRGDCEVQIYDVNGEVEIPLSEPATFHFPGLTGGR